MSTKYKTVLVLLVIAAVCILVGLNVMLASGVLNAILFLIGLIAFFLAIGVLVFAKKTDKTVGRVLQRAIEALLNFGFW